MQVQHAIAMGGECGIVGDEDERAAALAMAAEQKLDDVGAGRFVEIAGRFVGDDDGRIGRQRPGDRHALLLAA